MEIAVSYLKSKYTPEETIEKIEKSQADFIHMDLMDGIFVKKKNDDLNYHMNLVRKAIKPLDIHLMMNDPKEAIEILAKIKPKLISIHIEIASVEENLNVIRDLKIETGLAINPETKIEKLQPFLSKIDQVLVMSVHPGEGGQAFLEEVIPKLVWLKNYREENHLHYKIAIDGGINDQTIQKVKSYVDVAISGSYICMNEDYDKQIALLK